MTEEEARIEAIEDVLAQEVVDVASHEERLMAQDARLDAQAIHLGHLMQGLARLDAQVKDLENRLDRLFDDVHHGGD